MTWITDVRFALRGLRRAPGFSVAALLTLALGLGASAAIFSFLSGVLLSPLPWPNAAELMAINKGNPGFDFHGMSLDTAELERFRQRSTELAEISGVETGSANLIFDEGAQPVKVALVLPGLLDMVEQAPAIGRSFEPSDFEPGAESVVLLSHGVWRDHFAGAEELLGTSIAVDDGHRLVIGVLPPGEAVPIFRDVAIVEPLILGAEDLTQRSAGHWVVGLAKLRQGADLATAEAELFGLTQELEAEQPTGFDGWVPQLESLVEREVGDVRRPLLVLFGAVLLVLLIACANVASLLLARSGARRSELAVRRALGASQGRLIRQLMTENLVLSLVGGGLGVLVAMQLTFTMRSLAPKNLPRLDQVGLDARVIAFTFALAALSTLVFGLMPAMGAAGSRLRTARVVQGANRWSLRDGLTVAQVALALVLLVGAGLLLRSLTGLLSIDPGFATERVVRSQIQIPGYRYGSVEEQTAILERVVARVNSVAQVERAAAAAWMPLSGSWSRTGVVAGGTPDRGGQDLFAYSWLVSPGYFDAIGVPLLQGRDFSDADRFTADETSVVEEGGTVLRTKLAIVNQAMAQRFWPGQDVIGRRFGTSIEDPSSFEIIGVSGNVRSTTLGGAPDIGYYTPYAQNQQSISGFELIARVAGPTASIDDVLRAEVASLDPQLSVRSSSGVSEVVRSQLAAPRFQLGILGALALLALVLAMIGVYGLVNYAVTQRVREIGVRVALGASRSEVMRVIGGRGLRLVIAGLILGLAGALATTRIMESLLFEVSATDWQTFAAVVTVLSLVATAAVWLPARKATRVDPVDALRAE